MRRVRDGIAKQADEFSKQTIKIFSNVNREGWARLPKGEEKEEDDMIFEVNVHFFNLCFVH